jgi:hypothetical protein
MQQAQRRFHCEPCGRRFLAHHGPVVAPGPIPRLCDQGGTNRIQDHVPRQFQQVAVLVHQDGLEAPLEDMADTHVAAVEALRVNPIDLAHSPRQGWSKRLEEQVIVIAHQAPCPDAPIESVRHAAEVCHEGRTILVVEENLLAGVAACHYVVQRTSCPPLTPCPPEAWHGGTPLTTRRQEAVPARWLLWAFLLS